MNLDNPSLRLIDFYFTETGDFLVGGDGDLLSTESVPYRSINQEIRSRLTTYSEEWRMYPGFPSANLDAYIGQQNTPALASKIERDIRIALTSDGLIDSGILSVKVYPVDYRALSILVQIETGEDSGLEFQFLYDTFERGIF